MRQQSSMESGGRRRLSVGKGKMVGERNGVLGVPAGEDTDTHY
jgi:hypothetical protein